LTALPALPRLQRALVQATEYFAAELRQPSAAAPHWSELEWSMARAAAVLQGISPLLAGALRWRGPCEWQQFISQQRIHTELRHRRMQALLARIGDAARHAHIAIVPLKGAALYRLGLYTGGERPMADLDLLVADSDAAAAKRLLLRLGYLDTSVSWKHRVFEPAGSAVGVVHDDDSSFGEHAGRAINIDLHTRIAERLPLHTTDISGLMHPPEPHPGLNGYPSTAALFIHLLLHAAGNMVSRALRLIQLHDLALLAARMRDADWAQLLASRCDDQTLWWSVPPLELVARYYPDSVPASVLAALRPVCPRRLRTVARRQTLSEVSFATLTLEAFPGIAWSASLAEKLDYLISRVLPGREVQAWRAAITAKEAWAIRDPWSRMSHARRMLKWSLGTRTRPPAMHTVQRALEQPAIRVAPPPPHVDESRDAIRTP
jgi:hypothetical protein